MYNQSSGEGFEGGIEACDQVVRSPWLVCPRGPILKAMDRKPLPLTTVELQQSGSRLLHMTPKRILDVGCIIINITCVN